MTRLGSVRFFLIVPAPSHRRAIADALATYVRSWGAYAELMKYPTDAWTLAAAPPLD